MGNSKETSESKWTSVVDWPVVDMDMRDLDRARIVHPQVMELLESRVGKPWPKNITIISTPISNRLDF